MASRAPKRTQHRRQRSDASGSPLGNDDAAHDDAEEGIRFGDEPEDNGRKGSSGSGALRIHTEQQQHKPERGRTNGRYAELSGTSVDHAQNLVKSISGLGWTITSVPLGQVQRASQAVAPWMACGKARRH